MAATDNEYYQPVSTDETTALDGFSTRAIHHIAYGANNYQRYVAAFPLINEWCMPNWETPDTSTTTETVLVMWPRILVPDGFDYVAWTINHKQKTGTGDVTWRLYSSEKMPLGAATFATTSLSKKYGVGSIVTTGGAGWATPAANTSCEIARNNSGETYLILTGQNTSGSNAQISAIDAVAIIS